MGKLSKRLESELELLRQENNELKNKLTLERSFRQINSVVFENDDAFRLVIEYMQEGLIMVDNDDIILLVNPKLCGILGYQQHELIGQKSYEILIEAENKELLLKKNQDRIQGLCEQYEMDFLTRNNQRVPLLINASPIFAADGRVRGSMAICTDIRIRKHTEEALRQERAYFQQLYDTAPLGIVLLDNNDCIVDINKEFVNLFGYSREEAAGKQINDLIVPSNLNEEGWQLTTAVAEGKSFYHETSRRRKDGRQIYVSILGKPIVINDAQVAVYGMYQDITERKRIESAIREKNAFLHNLKDYSLYLTSVGSEENLYEAICLELKSLFDAQVVVFSLYHEPNKELEVVYNTLTTQEKQSLFGFLGRKAEGLRFKVDDETYYKIMSSVVGEADTLSETTFGSIPKSIGYLIEKTFGLKWFLGVALQYNGKLLGTIVMIGGENSIRPKREDMTAFAGVTANALRRWSIGKDLLVERERYQMLLYSMTQPVAMLRAEVNPRGIIDSYVFVDVNPAYEKLSRLPKDNLVGRNTREIFPGLTRDFFERFTQVLNTGNPLFVEAYEMLSRIFEVVAFKTKDMELAVIVADVTERSHAQKLREEVAVAKKSVDFKQKFLANMSHEIRTPLTGIIGMAEILSKTTLNHEQQDYLNSIRFSSENLREIINQILDYSKIEAGKLSLNSRPFQLSSMMLNAKDLFYSICKKDIFFKLEIDSKIPEYIATDEKRIFQVVTNLLSNAAKFTDKGEVVLSAGLKEFKDENNLVLEIRVRDTGIGMSEEEQFRVFEPFVDIEYNDRRNYEGTGLGLSISKEIAHFLGGDLSLESVLGKGSVFTFRFEAQRAEVDSAEENVKTDKAKGNGTPMQILLVEDKKVNQKVISLMLQSMGHSVQVAENGQVALDRFEPGKFDLILMDIQMPVMDGITATQKLRNQFAVLPPIVGLSANAFEGDKEKYMTQGLDDYLTKPVQTEDFEQLLQRLKSN